MGLGKERKQHQSQISAPLIVANFEKLIQKINEKRGFSERQREGEDSWDAYEESNQDESSPAPMKRILLRERTVVGIVYVRVCEIMEGYNRRVRLIQDAPTPRLNDV